MIILDTNILSAVMREIPDPIIVEWLDLQARESIWTTAITVFEIQLGLSILEKGKRLERLEQTFQLALEEIFEGRVLPFDEASAMASADIAAKRRHKGITVDMRDTQIAGIAVAKRSTLATRNTKDFQELTVPVINPWE
jgi:predicted nucleic acid-binding protein